MRKRVFLAILMIAAIVLTTSCSLIEKDTAVDASTVIIEVAGKSITKAEVQQAVENTMNYNEYMYSMYGLSYDRTDKETLATAQDSAITSLIQSAVIEQKATDQNLTSFTDEELADIQATVDETYTGYIDTIKTTYFADTDKTGDELDQAIADEMLALNYPTKDALLENQKLIKAEEKLKADVVKDVTVTDEDLQTAYDSRVETAKSTYAETPSQFGSDLNNGTTVYYRPAGFRYVKNILIKLTDEDSATITDLNTQITAKQTELDTATAASTADATATEAASLPAEDNTAAIAQLETELADLNTQLTAAKDKAYAAIQPTIDEIETKLAAGEDFDALMETYGQDTGMQSEPGKTNGYPVTTGDTNWVTEFTDASMALAKIGDVSAPFRTSYGIHIVKYVSDVQEGAVALDDIKDALTAELLTTKQDSHYTTVVEEWVTAANATVYQDRLSD